MDRIFDAERFSAAIEADVVLFLHNPWSIHSVRARELLRAWEASLPGWPSVVEVDPDELPAVPDWLRTHHEEIQEAEGVQREGSTYGELGSGVTLWLRGGRVAGVVVSPSTEGVAAVEAVHRRVWDTPEAGRWAV